MTAERGARCTPLLVDGWELVGGIGTVPHLPMLLSQRRRKEKQGAGRVHASALTLCIPRNAQSLPPATTAGGTRQRSPGTPSPCPQQQLPPCMGGMPRERTIHARSGAPVHIIANPALPRDVGTRQNRQEIHQEKSERKQNEPTLKRSPASDRFAWVAPKRFPVFFQAEDEIADAKKARKHEEMWEVDTMKEPDY
ncbi:hypothetical protein B0H14DRAFT_2602200 [Mycena olivaceomarginata]|nr:hypothetical protein B0H14DRAFT_2602200 [Mycena olivaceomarginata]